MDKVKIVVDSSTDIPEDLARDLGIVVIPMPVTIEGKTFLEGINLRPEQFYSRFKEFSQLPKTSQPNLQDLCNYYNEAGADGSSVVAIHLSSGLSGTVQTALLAKEMVNPGLQVEVIDSLGASWGAGMIAVKAAEAAQAGHSFAEIVQQVKADRHRMRYDVTINTLEYLIKGGRVSKVSGTVGTLLDIKPLLHITEDGRLTAYGKIRGRKAALRKLAENMADKIAEPTEQVVGIAHADCQEDAEALADEIRAMVQVKDITFSHIGCTIGSHTGPGCVALFYRAK